MSLRGKKLGLLISVPPDHANFHHGIALAEIALAREVNVYLYLIDDAVAAVDNPRVKSLQSGGLKLYACAYGAQRRSQTLTDHAIFGGLTIVGDLIAATDRFLAFN
jgi:hypothetical protein